MACAEAVGDCSLSGLADSRGSGGVDGGPTYSCRTATETLEWINAIIDFLKPYRFFLDAHVVNFFKDRLWEAVDSEWMDCLREEPVENLLQIPSGVVRDHWPFSLKEFILQLRSISLPRHQVDLQKEFPGLKVAPLNDVIAQGMNQKKKHEIEALAATISSIAQKVGASTIVDVGSGQGYLAQVLAFEHELSVIAIDSSSHHGSITDARAKRIEKYYAAKILKSRSERGHFNLPKTVTCKVLSSAMLKAVSRSFLQIDDLKGTRIFGEDIDQRPLEGPVGNESSLSHEAESKSLFVLAGLHACGDLSVTMLRTFVDCDDVKAVISIGCCYNLLSEEDDKEADRQCCFPLSAGVKSLRLHLGKNARDLACQWASTLVCDCLLLRIASFFSVMLVWHFNDLHVINKSAERWRGLGEAAGLHNFELHAFRAAFQMVLFHHYPEVTTRNPAIGRQGKALRRQHNRRILESNVGSTRAVDPVFDEPFLHQQFSKDEPSSVSKYRMFVKFSESGLVRLGLHDSHDIDFLGFWKEAEKFSDLIGPYWTLRASLGPVLETLLLLDRLLFLQEQGDKLEAVMLPLFDPTLSPRNVALIAKKL